MTTNPFLSLQEVDTELDAIGHRRPRLAEVVAHQGDSEALAAVQAEAATARARIDAATAAIAAAEEASAALVVKRTRLEGQLKTVIAPREAEALMSEIATLNNQRGEHDDAELAALDEQAAGEAELAQAAAKLPALEAALAASRQALDAATAALDGEATRLRARREELVAGLAAGPLGAYERARKQFGGVGVAHLHGSHCSGCHMDLSPAELDIVKRVPAGELGECPQCGRMLVR